jgi:hypothetical protein
MGKWIYRFTHSWPRHYLEVVSFYYRPLTPEERALGTHWLVGWVGPRTGLDHVDNRKILSVPGLEQIRLLYLQHLHLLLLIATNESKYFKVVSSFVWWLTQFWPHLHKSWSKSPPTPHTEASRWNRIQFLIWTFGLYLSPIYSVSTKSLRGFEKLWRANELS